MKSYFLRLVALAFVSSVLLPILAGCGKSEKAMQSPDGLSARQKREQRQGVVSGQ